MNIYIYIYISEYIYIHKWIYIIYLFDFHTYTLYDVYLILILSHPPQNANLFPGPGVPLKCTRDGPVASICYPDARETQWWRQANSNPHSPTVDGSEIRRSPVEMVNIPLFIGFFFTYQVVCLAGFLNHQQYVWFSQANLTKLLGITKYIFRNGQIKVWTFISWSQMAE